MKHKYVFERFGHWMVHGGAICHNQRPLDSETPFPITEDGGEELCELHNKTVQALADALCALEKAGDMKTIWHIMGYKP